MRFMRKTMVLMTCTVKIDDTFQNWETPSRSSADTFWLKCINSVLFHPVHDDGIMEGFIRVTGQVEFLKICVFRSTPTREKVQNQDWYHERRWKSEFRQIRTCKTPQSFPKPPNQPSPYHLHNFRHFAALRNLSSNFIHPVQTVSLNPSQPRL